MVRDYSDDSVYLMFVIRMHHRIGILGPDTLITTGIALGDIFTILLIDENLVFQIALGAYSPRDKLLSHGSSRQAGMFQQRIHFGFPATEFFEQFHGFFLAAFFQNIFAE